ncbi:carboxypeptidase-like regulatory domain-containing protein, partial [Fodinibius halophilus]
TPAPAAVAPSVSHTMMLRIFFAICISLVLINSAYAQQSNSDLPTGAVRGIVTDSTGKPLSNVHVSAAYYGDTTDRNGEFQIDMLEPGIHVVEAWRRDLITEKLNIKIEKNTKEVQLRMHRATEACCMLDGRWEITLIVYNDMRKDANSEGKGVKGTILFSQNYKIQLVSKRGPSDPTLDEFGKYNIDLTSILGKNFTSATTNTIFAGPDSSDILTEVHGYISSANEVRINLIPRMSHGGISMEGKITGNKLINGTWHKRDFATKVTGHFIMKRLPK